MSDKTITIPRPSPEVLDLYEAALAAEMREYLTPGPRSLDHERVQDDAKWLLGRMRIAAASADERYPPSTPEANARARAEGQTIALEPETTGNERAT